MSQLFQIILATFAISIVSVIGIITLSLKEKWVNKMLLMLVGLSTGALMGGAFLHLLPESMEKFSKSSDKILLYTLISFIIFFVIEKILHWRHCHKIDCEVHTFGTMNLFGDAVHNFIDGLIIAASFMANPALGVTTTIAVALHEIPQEIGDFGVLVYSGYTKKKALIFNLITALTAVLGGVIGYYITHTLENTELYLLPLAAGGFIYIAASDLIPEIRKEKSLTKSIITFLFFILGILIMYFAKE